MNETTSQNERAIDTLPAWIASPRISLLIILIATVVFRLVTLGHVELNGNDETAYLSLLQSFDEKGFAEMRSMIQTAP